MTTSLLGKRVTPELTFEAKLDAYAVGFMQRDRPSGEHTLKLNVKELSIERRLLKE